MVKKRLKDGAECRKCAQVAQLLQQRGYWDRIDEVVWAEESDAASPGMRLASQHGIETAPFFLVEDEGHERIYTSALHMMKECFQHTPSLLEQVEDTARNQPDDLGLP